MHGLNSIQIYKSCPTDIVRKKLDMQRFELDADIIIIIIIIIIITTISASTTKIIYRSHIARDLYSTSIFPDDT